MTASLAWVIALTLTAAYLPAAPIRYSITELGTLGGAYSHAQSINNSGQVAGYSWTASDERRAFLWDSTNGMRDLGTLGGAESAAFGINDHGQVVGWSYTPGRQAHAFLWQSGSGMQDLGGFSGAGTQAVAINNRGEVVGQAGFLSPFFWDASGGMRLLDLQGVGTPLAGFAYGINNSGQVVGMLEYSDPPVATAAFLWGSGSGTQLLGTLGGAYSDARAINDNGDVVGVTTTSTGAQTAFLWRNGSGMQDLGFPPGNTLSAATGINNHGQIVGEGSGSIFLYTNGQMFDVDTLVPDNHGWDFRQLTDINDAGQIIGWGFYQNQERAFLLTPVPEVATFAACGAALAGLALLRLRTRL